MKHISYIYPMIDCQQSVLFALDLDKDLVLVYGNICLGEQINGIALQ